MKFDSSESLGLSCASMLVCAFALASPSALAQEGSTGGEVAGGETTQSPEGNPDEPASEPVVPETVPEIQSEQQPPVTPSARFAALDARLSALAAERPNWFEMRTLATSAEGRPLRVAVVGERERSEPAEKPALLLLPGLADASLDRPEAMVRLLEELAAKIATDPNTPALLQRTTLYVLSAPLPDLYALAPGEAAPGPSPTLDFPVGWLPWSVPENAQSPGPAVGAGALRPGPYPLSRPETLALVDFLFWSSNVASVLEVQAPGAAIPKTARGGSLRAYCENALGLSYLYSGEQKERRVTLVERTLELLASLPDLRIDAPQVSPLGEDLWLVEARIANSGLLPQPEKALPAFIRVDGALLRTAMVRGQNESSFRPLASDRGGRIEVGPLSGGAERTLRIVLEAAEGTELVLRLRSALGGRASRALRLTKEESKE